MKALGRHRLWFMAAASSLMVTAAALWLASGQASEQQTAPAPKVQRTPPQSRSVRTAAPGSNRPGAAPPGRTIRQAPAATVEPHPITPERLRLEQQHHLFDEVEAAVQARQFDRARSLLREHQARIPDPEAWTDVREAWQTIADCLERRDAQAKARGQRFVDEERGSSMRRRVRRACLEPAD
jgi:hypothetical protein